MSSLPLEFLLQGNNHMFKVRERKVNWLCFLKHVSFDLSFIHTFWAGKIDQMQLGSKNYIALQVMALNVNSEETMRTSGGLIERGRGNLADEIAHHKQVYALFFILNGNLLDLFQLYTTGFIILNHIDLI